MAKDIRKSVEIKETDIWRPLADFLTEQIGDGFKKNADELEKLLAQSISNAKTAVTSEGLIICIPLAEGYGKAEGDCILLRVNLNDDGKEEALYFTPLDNGFGFIRNKQIESGKTYHQSISTSQNELVVFKEYDLALECDNYYRGNNDEAQLSYKESLEIADREAALAEAKNYIPDYNGEMFGYDEFGMHYISALYSQLRYEKDTREIHKDIVSDELLTPLYDNSNKSHIAWFNEQDNTYRVYNKETNTILISAFTTKEITKNIDGKIQNVNVIDEISTKEFKITGKQDLLNNELSSPYSVFLNDYAISPIFHIGSDVGYEAKNPELRAGDTSNIMYFKTNESGTGGSYTIKKDLTLEAQELLQSEEMLKFMETMGIEGEHLNKVANLSETFREENTKTFEQNNPNTNVLDVMEDKAQSFYETFNIFIEKYAFDNSHNFKIDYISEGKSTDNSTVLRAMITDITDPSTSSYEINVSVPLNGGNGMPSNVAVRKVEYDTDSEGNVKRIENADNFKTVYNADTGLMPSDNSDLVSMPYFVQDFAQMVYKTNQVVFENNTSIKLSDPDFNVYEEKSFVRNFDMYDNATFKDYDNLVSTAVHDRDNVETDITRFEELLDGYVRKMPNETQIVTGKTDNNVIYSDEFISDLSDEFIIDLSDDEIHSDNRNRENDKSFINSDNTIDDSKTDKQKANVDIDRD